MKVLCENKGHQIRIYLSGELDHNFAKGVMKSIDELIDEYLPRECVLDMRQLNFMDSSGIAVILRTDKHMAQIGGRMWVENCGGQALRVLDAAGINRIVKVLSK